MNYTRNKHRHAYPISGSDSFDSAINRRPNRSRVRFGSGIRFLIYPVIAVGAYWLGAGVSLNNQTVEKAVAYSPAQLKPLPPPMPPPPLSAPEPKADFPNPSEIVLKADRQGQFRGTVSINNVVMPFLIDTGATRTSIPEKLAYSARLPFGRPSQSKTAGGTVVDRLTKIDSLKIGETEIKHLDANINRYLNEVLIGMNTLKYFRMTQSGNTMTLIADNQAAADLQARDSSATSYEALAANQPLKKPVTIKKTVTCDSRQVCKTKYSDH